MGEEGSQESDSVVLSFSTPDSTAQVFSKHARPPAFRCHRCSCHTASVAANAMDVLSLKHVLPIPHSGHVRGGLPSSQNEPPGEQKREPHMMNCL